MGLTMPRVMPLKPKWDRLSAVGRAASVDRKNAVIKGYVVAQMGTFKSERGTFDHEALQQIVLLMATQPAGLKSRFSHPDMSNDGLGSYLGRARNPRMDGDRVRADLHLDPTSRTSPKGDIGGYVMDLAESDPEALSSSLVLQADRVEILDDKGRQKLDAQGEPIPPIWRPTKLMASDIVDTGDAVDGLLSAGVDVDGLPLSALWRGAEMLDRVFADQTRGVVEARCLAWLTRYLDGRYGPDVTSRHTRRLRLRLADLTRTERV